MEPDNTAKILKCDNCGEESTNPGQFLADGRWVCTESCRNDLAQSLAANGGTPQDEPARRQSMLYEVCTVCGGKGGFLPDGVGTGASRQIRCCNVLGVVQTGATARQLESLGKLDELRQTAGISAAMLRDGRARRMVQQFDPNQELTTAELTERFYTVKRQRDRLLFACEKVLKAYDEALATGETRTWNGQDVDDMRALCAEVRQPPPHPKV